MSGAVACVYGFDVHRNLYVSRCVCMISLFNLWCDGNPHSVARYHVKMHYYAGCTPKKLCCHLSNRKFRNTFPLSSG